MTAGSGHAQAVEAPVAPGEQGPAVASLQDALKLLLERELIGGRDWPDGPTPDELAKLAELLAAERGEAVYQQATQRLVSIVQLQHGLRDDPSGSVGRETAATLNRLLDKIGALEDDGADARVVRGRVTLGGGDPAVGFVVRALARDLRVSRPLRSHAHTDENGRYEIPYSAHELPDGGETSVNLAVRVYAEDARDREPLAESPVLFNAPAEGEIDLELPNAERPTEFELHAEAVEHALAGQAPDGGDLPLDALNETDVDFLAGETRIAHEQISWLIHAADSAQPDADGGASALPAQLLYGLFRQGLPTDLGDLAARPRTWSSPRSSSRSTKTSSPPECATTSRRSGMLAKLRELVTDPTALTRARPARA